MGSSDEKTNIPAADLRQLRYRKRKDETDSVLDGRPRDDGALLDALMREHGDRSPQSKK